MKVVVLLLLFFPLIAFSQQKLKKKYCGHFSGYIPSYKMDSGNDLITVDSVHIKIELLRDGKVNYTIGTTNYSGYYQVSFVSSAYIFITANITGLKAEERLKIYPKDKHMDREGIFPQPLTVLKKD